VNRDTSAERSLAHHGPMHELTVDVLLELIAAANEPLAVVHLDSPDWPVVLTNPAFDAISGGAPALGRPFPDVVEPMIGREMTREASGALRSGDTVSLPVDVGSREFLLLLVPVPAAADRPARYYAAYWRTAGQQLSPGRSHEPVRALAGATRRLRARTGDDPVTGLMNEPAFRDVLEHDWAVASREDTTLGPNAVVHHACRVGARCHVYAGAVVGSDGFGFAPDRRAGLHVKIPQVGIAVVDDDV